MVCGGCWRVISALRSDKSKNISPQRAQRTQRKSKESLIKKYDLPIGDMVFYSVVTAIFMVTAVSGAVMGWYGSGVMGFDAPPIPHSIYITCAGFFGLLFGAGCSTPCLLVFFALALGRVTNGRISRIWFIGSLSACFFALLMMILTLAFPTQEAINRIVLLALGAIVPPGFVGLRLIVHIAQTE